VTKATPGGFPGQRAKRLWILWLILVVLLGVVGWVVTSNSPSAQQLQEAIGLKQDRVILDNALSVGPHTFRYYKIAQPQGSTHVAVVGQFTSTNFAQTPAKASEDAARNIELYILTEGAFAVWQNGYATSSVYESGRVSQGAVQVELPTGAGIYYLVFSNKFSPKAAKSVHATFFLRYKRSPFFN
jgi:hypothetical protein